MGMRLAEALRGSLIAVGLTDGGMRALTIAILRETRMPAVQVEMGVAASAADAARMRGDAFASDVATAVAEGVERFLGSTVPNEVTVAS
jgi:N-acetylmuramoyl-L-alanine amidase